MKAAFFTQPCAEPDTKKDEMVLLKDWRFVVDAKEFYIPASFSWDGASIPRVFWSIVGDPFEPDFWAASLAHDWLYLTHQTNRAIADDLLYQFLRLCGVGAFRARTMWSAVRVGGAGRWATDKKNRQELDIIKASIAGRPDAAIFGALP